MRLREVGGEVESVLDLLRNISPAVSCQVVSLRDVVGDVGLRCLLASLLIGLGFEDA